MGLLGRLFRKGKAKGDEEATPGAVCEANEQSSDDGKATPRGGLLSCCRGGRGGNKKTPPAKGGGGEAEEEGGGAHAVENWLEEQADGTSRKGKKGAKKNEESGSEEGSTEYETDSEAEESEDEAETAPRKPQISGIGKHHGKPRRPQMEPEGCCDSYTCYLSAGIALLVMAGTSTIMFGTGLVALPLSAMGISSACLGVGPGVSALSQSTLTMPTSMPTSCL